MTIEEAVRIMEKKRTEDRYEAKNGLYPSWKKKAEKAIEFDDLILNLLAQAKHKGAILNDKS